MYANFAVTVNNQVLSNTAIYGGGFYGGGNLKDNTFIANTANYGGGLYIWYTILTNTIVANNRANIAGSGLYIEEFSLLVHSTIAQNNDGDGTGIYVANYGYFQLPTRVALTNTILVSQTVGITVAAGSTATLNSTLWNGNTTNWGGAGTIIATNNYSGTPGFINPSAGNYHLSSTSAAIDKAINVGVTADIDGDIRPQGPAPDLGADEYVAVPFEGKSFLPVILKK